MLKFGGIDPARFGLKPFRPPIKLIGLAVLSVVVSIVVSSLTTPILEAHFGEVQTERFAAVRGNLPLFLYVLPLIWLFAAFGEEFFYRGVLMGGLAVALGGGRWAWAIAFIVQAVIFGLGHAYQGTAGMIAVAISALIDGAVFLFAGRNLWPCVLAHGLQDTLGFTLLYLGVIDA